MRRFLRAFCLGLLALGVSAGAAQAADGLSAPKLEPTISGQPPIETEAERVTQPVVEAVEPIVEGADRELEPVSEPVVEGGGPLHEPVRPFTDAIDPFLYAVDPVIEVVDPVLEPLKPIRDVVDPLLEPVGPATELVDPFAVPAPLPGPAPDPLIDNPPRIVQGPLPSSVTPAPEVRVDTGSIVTTAMPRSTVPEAEPSLTRLIDLPPPFSRKQVAQMAGITLAIGGALWVALFGLGLLTPPFRAGGRPWVGPLLMRGLVPIPAVPPG